MRKLRLTRAYACARPIMVLACSILFTFFISLGAKAQCDPISGSVTGNAFLDTKLDGTLDSDDSGISNIMVTAFDKEGTSLGFALTDASGAYIISDLTEGENVLLQFTYANNYSPAPLGPDNGTSIQIASVPSCDNNIGLVDPTNTCSDNPELLLTCFGQGEYNGPNKKLETIVGIEHNFTNASPGTKYAELEETGSIWGLAWKNITKEIFSSAFVKQYVGLKDGSDAIYKTYYDGTKYVTSLYTNISDLGAYVKPLVYTDINDCDYGKQVGRYGLGALVLSPDENWLYTVNLSDNTLVKFSSYNPIPETTTITPIPDPGCANGDGRAFALVFRGDDLYVGVTCTGETSYINGASPTVLEAETSANVFKYTPDTGDWNLEFTTNYIKGYWRDDAPESYNTIHWLTDLDFTDDGNMLLSLSDMVGHRFCNASQRIDQQHPDLLMVYKDSNGVWQLEDNGQAEITTPNGNVVISGSGIDNGEGPGGGEFFGFDNWTTDPIYHSETALGSIVVLPGTGSVVAMVYDPITASYSGGMHRYSTTTGDKISQKQLYERNIDEYLGKATGFGDVVVRCGAFAIEIGNYVWADNNNNGIQDSDESGIANLPLVLLDEECNIVANTTTDANGKYSFNNDNVDTDNDGVFDGLKPNELYYVKVGYDADETGTYYIIDGEIYNICSDGEAESQQMDCDIHIIQGVCNDQPLVEVMTDASGINNYSFDIGLYIPQTFDLALKKEIISGPLVKYKSAIDFKITVINQGDKIANGVTVTDYMNSAYTFDEAENPGWTMQGDMISYQFNGNILPNEQHEFYLKLKVGDFNNSNDLLNFAEISGASDNNGPVTGDTDSSFDQIMDNDHGAEYETSTDDEVDDNGEIDEDDHDVAGPHVFDLALKIEDKVENKVYTAGDRVDFVISVYNQGLINAESFTIVDYIPEGLEFLEADNENWLVNGSMMTLEDGEGIVAGTKKTYCISFTIDPQIGSVDQIVNNAEIANQVAVGGLPAVDYDSTPDMVFGNDIGGLVNSGNDNLISDHGDVDEDDEDPVVVKLKYLDLALIKTAVSEIAKDGEIAAFNIEVINQGTEDVKSFTIVDYYPEELSLEDENWTTEANSNKAYRTVELETALNSGKSHHLDISFRISENLEHKPFVNYAEIFSVYDANGKDISKFDVDSDPDDDQLNDAGGKANSQTDDSVNLPRLQDEDDADPAMMQFIFGEFVSQCLCISPEEGLFGNSISITAPVGQTWYIDQTVGLENLMYTEPDYEVVSFDSGPDGFHLTETEFTDDESKYYFPAVSANGQAFQITFKNENGETVTLSSEACNNGTIVVEGDLSLCSASTADYTISNPQPGVDYTFTLDDGGALTQTSNTTATVVWEDIVGGPYEIEVAATNYDLLDNNCQESTILGVMLGVADGPMTCIADVNISLNSNCEVVVTPQTVAAGPLDPTSPYSLMLLMPDDSVIPNNTLTEEHLGMEITAKLIEGCGGNSCWSTITVEDKLGPVLYCEDSEIVCFNFDDYQGPIAIDACEGIVTPYQVGPESIYVYDCHPDYVRKVTRSYQAEDSNGNKSEVCTIDIFVKKIDINDIVYPADIVGDDAFACDEIELDDNGFPLLEITGVPTIYGEPLIPGITPMCQIAMDYNDRLVGPIGCTTKVMREFRLVYNTCEFVDNGTSIDSIPVTQIFKHTQTIELEDNNPPVFEQMDDISVSAGSGNCEASVFLPEPTVTDACAEDIEIDIRYEGGFINDQSSAFVVLPVGVHEVKYLAYDECGNLDSMAINVTVMDMTAPVVVCDVPTAIGINSNGIGYAYASSFDDGSTDACGIDYMQVRRLDAGAACGPQSTTFGDFVVFCCEDVGVEVMVELLVVDFAGNENSCMVSVEIQDKFPPMITCPSDVTIECGTSYDLNDLSVYGEAVAFDACMVNVTESASFEPTNTCGEGVITRTFVASDNSSSSTCTQSITIVNTDPFVEGDITFPLEYVTETCNLEDLEPDQLPAPYNQPIIDFDECDMIAFAHSDQIFDFSGDNACFKIYRKWTVINWCVMIDGSPETFVGYQVIKVNNTAPPTIEESCEPIVACSYDDNCVEGEVTLIKTATDDCTQPENIIWSYVIQLESGDIVEDNGLGNEIDASGVYELGHHSITYTFEDRCGNLVSCIQAFTITNCTPPQAVCIDGLAVELVPMDTDNDGEVDTEMACLFAHQLNASSAHTCDLPITYSFSADTSDTKKIYDCNNLGPNEVTLWVTDSNGNTDICVTTIIVQDNNDVNLCSNVEGCATFPADVTITECNADLDPVSLGLLPVVDSDCANCDDYTVTFTDEQFTYPNDDCNYITRTFVVTFNCFNTPISLTGSHVISVLDVVAPTIICPTDGFGAAVDGSGLSCEAEVTLEPATYISNCNSSVNITNNSIYATNGGADASGVYPVGTTVVTFTATDGCGNSSTCDINVVVTDDQAPTCNLQDITVNIDANGTVVVNFDDLDNGSSDACGGLITAVSISPNSFTCENLGLNFVTVIIEDESGNAAACTDVGITVVDDDAPICMTQDITVSILDGNTSVSIDPEDVDNGSSDGCSTASLVSVVPDTFTCDDLGDNEVTLTVTDEDGNTSTCTATVTVDDLVAPICNAGTLTVSLDGTVVSSVTITGDQIDNGSVDDCGTIVSYDVTPDTFTCDDLGTNTVVMTVTDDNGNTSTCEGTVIVEDNGAPECNTKDATVALDASGNALINALIINDGSTDACGFVQSVSVNPFIFNCDDLGENIVTMTAVDNSGNSSTCTAIVTLIDTLGPVCNAMDITVSLTSEAGISISGANVDNGSVDGCGGEVIVTVEPDLFTCDDVGDNLVTVTTTDQFGNTSTCVSTVTVEDNIELQCVAQDITISLDDNGQVSITPEDIDNGSTGGCSDNVELSLDREDFECNDMSFDFIEVTLTVTLGTESSTCTANVTVIDDTAPAITCMDDVTVDCVDFTGDLENYGNVDNITATDNCSGGLQVIEQPVVTNINTCGVGTYTRTFVATDNAGNSTSCVQVVTVQLGDNPLVEADLTFPPDTVTFGDCSTFDPDNIDSSIAIDSTEADCFNVSFSFVDTGINTEMPCNDTITRTYTVLDSCQIGTGQGEFTFVQTIIINDTTAPLVEGPEDITVTIQDTATCLISLDLSDFEVINCDENYTLTNDSPYAIDNNSGDASGDYPVGDHDITLTVIDDCNNSSTYQYNVNVLDTTYVTFSCLKLQRPMETDLAVDLVAEDLIDSILFFNCLGTVIDTVISYSSNDINDTIMTFGCEAVAKPLTEFVFIWIDGMVIDSCKGSIQLLDPDDLCMDGLVEGTIVGSVLTADNEPVPGVFVDLDGSEENSMTDLEGKYAFPNMPSGGAYEVIPTKDDDPMNGVTTLDLILIQRHILGYQDLDSPYDLIAADINANGSLSGLDIIQLRKMILGVYDDFPDNTSWRMIDRNFTFWDAENAQEENFPETYNIDALLNTMKADFIGIKTGDVNGTVAPNATTELVAETRSTNTWYLQSIDKDVKAGETVTVKLNMTDSISLQGFQLAIATHNVSNISLASNNILIDHNNYSVSRDGIVKISWNTLTEVTLANGSEILEMTFVPNVDGRLSDMLYVSFEDITSQTYSHNEVAYDSAELIWATEQSEFTLFQNNPNPWTESTDISFMIPTEGDVTINIRSVDGQLIKTFSKFYEAGVHKLRINNDDQNSSGLYFYEMRFGNDVKIERMILVK